MKNRVILISIDGMRPDGFMNCGSEAVKRLLNSASYSLEAKTVFPSVTLPCHMSLFYGVVPSRHGIISNTYVPQVHQVKGLFEKIADRDGICSIFYGWEYMRDVAPAGTSKYAAYINAYTDESVDTTLTDLAIKNIEEKHPDFVYLYLADTDDKGGHDCGWMSEEYLRRVKIAIENAERIVDRFGEEYSIVITADHGGHDRMHGTDMKEDMTIPILFIGKEFEKGKVLDNLSILDIAPTIAKLFGLRAEKEWEGVARF